MANEYTCILTSTLKNFKLELTNTSKIISSDNNFTLTLIGSKSEINSYLPLISFVATESCINKAKTLESSESIDIIEKIQIELYIIKSDNKKYKTTGYYDLILDSYKHSDFSIKSSTPIISNTNFTILNNDNHKAFLTQVNDVTWNSFSYNTSLKNYVYINQLIADAEKHPPNANYDDLSNYATMDDNLCWAASSSNMIEFTGWWRGVLGLLPNQIDREDVLFRYFINHTQIDDGYNQYLGIIWFSTGQYTDIGAWKPKSGSGGNLLNFDLTATPDIKLRPYDFTNTTTITQVQYLQVMELFLRNGCGVGIAVYDTTGQLAHAVTVIGISYNVSQPKTSYSYYTGLFIVDSDDQHSEPISSHVDMVKYCPIKYNSAAKNYYIDIYGNVSVYGNVYMKLFVVLGRNNNFYEWFYNYGSLIENSTNFQLRVGTTFSSSNIFSKFISSDLITN